MDSIEKLVERERNVRFLGGTDDGEVTIEFDYKVFPPGKVIRKLRKLKHVVLTQSSSWLLSDDFWVEFEYKGQEFRIDTPFVNVWLHYKKGCNESEVQALIENMLKFRS